MGMDYAHAVRYLFEKSGMSQAELCRRGGFSRAYVSMLLSGKVTNPNWDARSIDTTVYLRFCGVSYDSL